jgi:hypothetical protein
VFHRGQFADESTFKELCSLLNIYKWLVSSIW